MAELTKGYPFAFQVLGYLTWNNNGNFQSVIKDYQQYLSEFVYDKLWSELSEKDRIVANGIAANKIFIGRISHRRHILRIFY